MSAIRIDPATYAEQLSAKLAKFRHDFAALALPPPEVFPSTPQHYRERAEFSIFHDGASVSYVMFAGEDRRQRVTIDSFPIASQRICAAMALLRGWLNDFETLRRRLFQVNFLSTLSGELLVTLLYHRPLDAAWEQDATALAAALDCQMIGRSRGEKRVIGRDWVREEFELTGRRLRYQQIEGSFSQPNGGINRQMLGWACAQVAGIGGDLLELYCGNGNFTVALAPSFDRVLATEVSKSSVRAATHNLAANGIDNTMVVRMSSEEISAALSRVRAFNRLRDVDLDQYRFSTLFVDPPRSGLDDATIKLARGFDHILYISCNPATLRDNVLALLPSHEILAAAAFDQFPYTDHLECGLLLRRRAP